MKKIIFLLAISIVVIACKKPKVDPDLSGDPQTFTPSPTTIDTTGNYAFLHSKDSMDRYINGHVWQIIYFEDSSNARLDVIANYSPDAPNYMILDNTGHGKEYCYFYTYPYAGPNYYAYGTYTVQQNAQEIYYNTNYIQGVMGQIKDVNLNAKTFSVVIKRHPHLPYTFDVRIEYKRLD